MLQDLLELDQDQWFVQLAAMVLVKVLENQLGSQHLSLFDSLVQDQRLATEYQHQRQNLEKLDHRKVRPGL